MHTQKFQAWKDARQEVHDAEAKVRAVAKGWVGGDSTLLLLALDEIEKKRLNVHSAFKQAMQESYDISRARIK